MLLPTLPPLLLGSGDTGKTADLETGERADDFDKPEFRALMLVAAASELPGGMPWRTDICLTSCTSGVPCSADKFEKASMISFECAPNEKKPTQK